MTRRQKERKAARVACHNAREDSRDRPNVQDVYDHECLRGPVLRRKPSVAKVRRLLARASRKANRG